MAGVKPAIYSQVHARPKPTHMLGHGQLVKKSEPASPEVVGVHVVLSGEFACEHFNYMSADGRVRFKAQDYHGNLLRQPKQNLKEIEGHTIERHGNVAKEVIAWVIPPQLPLR